MWWVDGDQQDFSVSPSPLGTNQVLELIGTWIGLDLGGFRITGFFGTGLIKILLHYFIALQEQERTYNFFRSVFTSLMCSF